MDVLPIAAGVALLVAGTIFALMIGMMSNRDEDEREHLAGS